MSVQGIGNEAIYRSPQIGQEKAERAEKAGLAGTGQAPDAAAGRASAQELAAAQSANPAAQGASPAAQEPKLAQRPRYDRYEPERKEEICTTDTGKVDREIEKLREKKTRLSRQIQMTDDPQKKEELKRQLAKAEQELKQKDNDTYRRQNAEVTGA